ncbi:MAG: TetR family transcriptional regulator C-terminal domain-containing protein, partial [Pseudomonadota bacterium]
MPKSVDIEVKRSEFITASVDVIALEGLPAATLRRIAEKAGCTTGSLTHYYSDRKSLLLETLRAVHNAAGQRMVETVAGNTSDFEKLHAVLREALPLDETRLKEWRVWLAFWANAMDDEALTAENTKRYQQWCDAVEQLLSPFIAPEEVKTETAYLIALVDGLGVGIARQAIHPTSLSEAQAACENSIVY